MGRKPGARNQNHEAVRSQLATSIGMQLLTAGGRQPSLRALAEGAEVDPGTLRHYFGTREGAIQAAFDQLSSMGGDQMARGRALAALPAREAFKTLLTRIAEAWQGPLGSMHAAGFGEGMASTGVSPAALCARRWRAVNSKRGAGARIRSCSANWRSRRARKIRR